MVVGDVYDIEERVKELDPDLSLGFNYETENYRVYHKDLLVMEWPRPLDARLITHLRKIDIRNGYNPLKEIDDHNDKLERAIEKERYNRLEDAVKYYQPKLRDEIDGVQMKHVF